MSAAEKLPEVPALSPSIAHILTSESPLHAWSAHRLLGNKPKPSTDEMEWGKILHAVVLSDMDRLHVIDADSFRTNAAREARDTARAAGLIPVCAPAYEEALADGGRIANRIADLGYDLATGASEQRVEWTEFAVHGNVTCHGGIDWLRHDRQLIIDLKTHKGSGSPDACAGRLVHTAGVIQAAAYPRAIASLDPSLAGRIEFVFLFAQTVEPFAVTPIACAGSMNELGENRWERAIESWSRCLATNDWPSYATSPVRVEAPAWVLARELMEEAA